jgi:hypothetical protein
VNLYWIDIAGFRMRTGRNVRPVISKQPPNQQTTQETAKTRPRSTKRPVVALVSLRVISMVSLQPSVTQLPGQLLPQVQSSASAHGSCPLLGSLSLGPELRIAFSFPVRAGPLRIVAQ